MASKFEAAFAAARKSGKKTFSFKGKSYTTELAKDTPKKGPVPKSRQGSDKGSGGRSTATKAAPSKPDKMPNRPNTPTPAKKKKTLKDALGIKIGPTSKRYSER